MGRRGPAPTPTALRVLRGNPGRRPLNHAEPKPDVLTEDSPLAACPTWLTGDARDLWDRIVPGGIRCGLLTIVDLPALEALCRSYGKWREAERKVDEVGLELAIAKGYQNTAVKERQLMLQFGARFGFDPSSRSNVKLPAQKPQSKVDAFRRAKAGA